MTITGAVANDECVAGAPTTPGTNITVSCYVSAANTVQIKLCNVGTAVITPPSSGVYSARIFDP